MTGACDPISGLRAPAAELPPEEPPPEEPEIVRHDPFAYMRGAAWMNRKLSPSGRAAAFLRRELKAFPVIEGRDPNGADLDAIVKRTVDYMVPIFKRERATDIAYDELEKRRQRRLAPANSPELAAPAAGAGDAKSPGRVRDFTTDGADMEAVDLPSGRAIAPNVEPPSNSPEFISALQQWKGRRVVLPNGKPVVDDTSPTGHLMSPFADLGNVAAAGRQAGARFRALLALDPAGTRAFEYAYEAVKATLGQGGDFDYQRRINKDDPSGFTQLRQFRNVSNVNVGLYMQQMGVPRWMALEIAGRYARRYSSNAKSDQPYGLDPQTREFIELGYKIGSQGHFD